jgi:asparagine synthase (glutamine-hydrolysing)
LVYSVYYIGEFYINSIMRRNNHVWLGHSGSMPIHAISELMANTIKHRGPDDFGVWMDEPLGICLTHRRLSVLDLSPAGHQPMLSVSGRYVIVFNGEFYSHRRLDESAGKTRIGYER